MTYSQLSLGLHAAYLDQLSGVGLLQLPDPATDVLNPVRGYPSVHDLDFQAAVKRLVGLGWHITEDDDPSNVEGWFVAGGLGGRRVIELAADEPIDGFDPEDFTAARADLLAELGVTE